MNTNVHLTSFFTSLKLFRSFYIENIVDNIKTIPILYLRRSIKENCGKNNVSNRRFHNIEEFSRMISKNNISILDIDDLSSFHTQFNTVIKSKIIIMEMGSVFTINATFIAENSHIIILNDFLNYYSWNNNGDCFHKVMMFLMKERKNTVDIFDTCYNIDNIDIDKFEKFINNYSVIL